MSCGFLITALTACAFSCVAAKDQKFSSGGMEVQIKGKSGKFKVYRKNAGENETNTIEVEMDSLTEVDAKGKMVGKKGKVKHSINSFASQEFEFLPLEVVRLGYNNNTVKASKTSFTSTVGHKSESIGKVRVDTFVVDQKGFVGPDDDTLWEVVPGDMKFNIELSNWTWCGQAKNGGKKECAVGKSQEVGQFIDLVIKIKGKNTMPVRKPEPSKDKDKGRAGKGKKSDFVMGGGINLRLTNLVEIDGNVTEMPEGYPKVTLKGGKDTIFTFRFPKFATKAVYDPLLTSGAASAEALASQAAGLSVLPIVSVIFAVLASKLVF